MSLQSLFPIGGDHAIQSAAIGLGFDSALAPTQLASLRHIAASSLLSEFSGQIQDQQLMQFNLGHPSAPVVQTPMPGGFLLTKPGHRGALRTIEVNPGELNIVFYDYTRWAEVRNSVSRYLEKLQGVFENRALTNFGLQYTDIFNWRDDPKSLVLSEVFKSRSKYLAGNIFDLPAGALWHSHHGYFEDVEGAVPYRRLDNININRNDASDSQSLVSVTSHRVILKSPMWAASGDRLQLVKDELEQLHIKNKEILSEILTDEVKSKIKFNKKEEASGAS